MAYAAAPPPPFLPPLPRRPLPVKKYLAGWNLALSLVSAVGAFRVGSHLLYLLSPWGGYTFRDTICR